MRRNHLHLSEFQAPQEVAEDVLAEFQERFSFPYKPPIPVEMIARSLFGLECVEGNLGNFGAGTSGMLNVKTGTIEWDSRFGWHGHNFSIAHELGHWILHEEHYLERSLLANRPGVLPKHRLGSSRAKATKEKEHLLEVEANRFAAALLIPYSFLIAEASVYRAINNRALRELAQIFDVSLQAMFYRLADLQDHLQWPGPFVEADALNMQAAHSRTQSKTDRAPSHKDGLRQAPHLTLAREIASPQTEGMKRQLSNGWGIQIQASHSLPKVFREIDKSVVTYKNRKRQQQRYGRINTPWIIEFAGTANAGKDTQIAIISDYLQDVHGCRVRVIDEAIKACYMDKSSEIHRLYKTVALTVARLHEAKFENPGEYDFIIFNRGVFDTMALIRAAHHRGQIRDEQAEVHLNYLSAYAGLEDMVLLLLISPEESLRREEESLRHFVTNIALQRDGKPPDPQRVHQPEILGVQNASYIGIHRNYGYCFKQVCLPDSLGTNNGINGDSIVRGDNQSVLDRARAISRAILDLQGVSYVTTQRTSPAHAITAKTAQTSSLKQLSLFDRSELDLLAV